jgi:hypothetical protein
MTWRVRLAVCQTEDFAAYIRLLVEEDRVRTLILERSSLGPVLTPLSPQKNERMH